MLVEDLEEDTDKFSDVKLFKEPKALEFCQKFRLDHNIFEIKEESNFAEVLSKLMKQLAKIKKKKKKKGNKTRNSIYKRNTVKTRSPVRKSRFEKYDDEKSGKNYKLIRANN